MSVSFFTRLAGLMSGRSETSVARRTFIGAAVAGAALAAVPPLVSSSAQADESDRDHIGDALEDLRKARRELSQIDHDRLHRDRALQQVDQAINATQQIQRGPTRPRY
jgi:uncharacterized membrane protein YccC